VSPDWRTDALNHPNLVHRHLEAFIVMQQSSLVMQVNYIDQCSGQTMDKRLAALQWACEDKGFSINQPRC